ncbi:MAG: hypothetical protein EP321_10890 [Sphingomonadales bacterium]|nr:MAG: hypothetical protein EP345_15315 [Sphingomonadales bacterium]TNF03332.1 MAG: hypothetical protein EP321_10890 [Sphingomonadales bacterium]
MADLRGFQKQHYDHTGCRRNRQRLFDPDTPRRFLAIRLLQPRDYGLFAMSQVSLAFMQLTTT